MIHTLGEKCLKFGVLKVPKVRLLMLNVLQFTFLGGKCLKFGVLRVSKVKRIRLKEVRQKEIRLCKLIELITTIKGGWIKDKPKGLN